MIILNYANVADTKATIEISGFVGGWGYSLEDIQYKLSAMKSLEEVEVVINSAGGLFVDGLGIYNYLKRLQKSGVKVTTEVLALAGSAASIIFMAGSERKMPTASHIMIHRVKAVSEGEADDLRSMAKVLDDLDLSLLNVYKEAVDIDEETLFEMLKKETWLTAEDAVEMGFATSVIDNSDVTNDMLIDSIKNMSALLSVSNEKPSVQVMNKSDEVKALKDIREVEAFLRDVANLSISTSKAFISNFKRVVRDEQSVEENALKAVALLKEFQVK